MYSFPNGRKPGTKSNGSAFNRAELFAVFTKGRIAPGRNPDRYRFDACGALMDFELYGDTTEKGYGWEVDHINPVARGGTTVLSNLQPLQWQNNRKKSDNVPGQWSCAIRLG